MASTTTQTRSVPRTRPESSYDLPWKVVVRNDPVNLMSYVVMVFRRVFGYDESRARKHMLEVHHEGRSVLWTGHREAAESYVASLLEWQLTAALEPGDEKA